MTTNSYFTYLKDSSQNETDLYKSIIEDVIKATGIDVYYLPRSYQVDELWNEDILSSFSTKHEIEMYIDSAESFEGDGDILQQLGLSVNDQLHLIVHPDRFTEETGMDIPLEGDLIYFGLTNGLFQIKFVEHEDPWYQTGNVTMLRLRTELFQANQEEMDTGISPVDSIDDAITDDQSDQNTELEDEADESQFNPDNPFGQY